MTPIIVTYDMPYEQPSTKVETAAPTLVLQTDKAVVCVAVLVCVHVASNAAAQMRACMEAAVFFA
jgi:hypothetical protein